MSVSIQRGQSVSPQPAAPVRRDRMHYAARTTLPDARIPAEDELLHWASWFAARELPQRHRAKAANQRYQLAVCANCGHQFVALVSGRREDECFITTCSSCGQAVRY